MARLFGTDGVRGVANEELTPMLAMQLGQAVSPMLVFLPRTLVCQREILYHILLLKSNVFSPFWQNG